MEEDEVDKCSCWIHSLLHSSCQIKKTCWESWILLLFRVPSRIIDLLVLSGFFYLSSRKTKQLGLMLILEKESFFCMFFFLGEWLTGWENKKRKWQVGVVRDSVPQFACLFVFAYYYLLLCYYMWCFLSPGDRIQILYQLGQPMEKKCIGFL